MRTHLLAFTLAAVALALPRVLAAQVCPVAFSGSDYPSVTATPWTLAQTEGRLFDNILGLCGALAEDFPTGCADDEILKAAAGALVCAADGGAGSAVEVREVDGAPAVSAVTQLAFDQADGFTVSTGGAGLARLDLTVVADSHAHTGATVSALDAADTTTGIFDPARLPAATTSAQGAVELAESGESAAGLATQANDARLSDARTPTTHQSSHAENGGDELLGEALGTACADGQILKANATGGLDCGAAGSAAFSTLDADYGGETLTSAWTIAATWDASGAKIEAPNGTSLVAGDCDDAAEAGRVFVDTDATTGRQLYVCEGAAGWVLQGDGTGGTGGPEGAQYHPDRAPASGLVAASSDEFEDGFETTWRWANQGGATDTAELDTALLNIAGAGSANYRVRWVDAPAASDFVVTAKMSPGWTVTDGAAGEKLCGIILLVTGTEGTPTALRQLSYRQNTTGQINIRHGSSANYTTGPTSVAETASDSVNLFGGCYLQLRFVTSTDALTSYVSCDGMTWSRVGQETLAGDPISVGRFVSSAHASNAAICRAHWFRTCTSAACLNGEVGE